MKLPSWLTGKKPDEPKPPELALPKVDPKYEAEQAAARQKAELLAKRAEAPDRGGAARILKSNPEVKTERQAKPQPEKVVLPIPPSQEATRMEAKPTPQAAPSPGGMGHGGGYHNNRVPKPPAEKPPEEKPPLKSFEDLNDIGGHKKGRRY